MQNGEKEVRDLLLLETQSQVPGTWQDVLPSEFMSVLPQNPLRTPLEKEVLYSP